MKRKGLRWLFISLIAIVLVIIIYKTIYPEPINIALQRPDFTLSADELAQGMSQAALARKYGGKVILTYGRVSSIDGNILMLKEGVIIHLSEVAGQKLAVGDSITIKGRCIGYDNLLEEVKMDQAYIVQE